MLAALYFGLKYILGKKEKCTGIEPILGSSAFIAVVRVDVELGFPENWMFPTSGQYFEN